VLAARGSSEKPAAEAGQPSANSQQLTAAAVSVQQPFEAVILRIPNN
jgi:hypothetical protein